MDMILAATSTAVPETVRYALAIRNAPLRCIETIYLRYFATRCARPQILVSHSKIGYITLISIDRAAYTVPVAAFSAAASDVCPKG